MYLEKMTEQDLFTIKMRILLLRQIKFCTEEVLRYHTIAYNALTAPASPIKNADKMIKDQPQLPKVVRQKYEEFLRHLLFAPFVDDPPLAASKTGNGRLTPAVVPTGETESSASIMLAEEALASMRQLAILIEYLENISEMQTVEQIKKGLSQSEYAEEYKSFVIDLEYLLKDYEELGLFVKNENRWDLRRF